MKYGDFEIHNAGVFQTLEEAVNFCKNTKAYYAYPSETELPYLQAYNIEEWLKNKLIATYFADGNLKDSSL